MQVYNWIKTVGEDFLDNNRVMGDSVKTSQDFVYAHRELDSEKQVIFWPLHCGVSVEKWLQFE